MPFVFLSLLMGIVACASPNLAAETRVVVIAPIADLRSDPSVPAAGVSDSKEETQLLFGETVRVIESSGAWSRIEAIEQPSFKYHQRWEGYPGWVLKKSLLEISGTPRPPSVATVSRSAVLKTAEAFLGTPYYWGGLSTQGIDCSGLIHLAFRLNGRIVPRDSFEQHMQATRITHADLKPADLIFSAPVETPKKITHVALFAGDDAIIEAPQTGMVVRKIPFKEKYGRDLVDVESGETIGNRVIYFGRLIP